METLLAKSDRTELKKHSEDVKKIGLAILKYSIKDELQKELENLIIDVCLLHDIGKATTSFQDMLIGKSENEKRNKFRHNEIAWAFLEKYLVDDYPMKDILTNSVYWHHGISNKVNTYSIHDILKDLDEKSIENMLLYLKSVIDKKYINLDIDMEVFTKQSPLYYEKDKIKNLPKLQLVRSILITADRMGSDENNIYTEKTINKYFEFSSKFNINCKYSNSVKDKKRYDKQVEIIKSIKKTTIIKAPAGFGKTLVGVQWAIEQGKRILWVTPRNTVAESVYQSIAEECSALSINPTIQLILGGEVKKGNEKIYNADIIVTNIDNYLAPSFNSKLLINSSLINGTTVVFDEFHELVTDAPLMGVFVSLMKLRHNYSNAKTLLLSATPTLINMLWDKIDNETLILPNEKEHFLAIHKEKYELNVVDIKPKVKGLKNTLVIKNSIKNAQEEMMTSKSYIKLLHSKFDDNRKSNDLKYLIENYGKKANYNIKKPNILGTHILQASLDISFSNLIEDALSPEASLQRLGRCNRWGEYTNSTFTIYKSQPKTKEYVRDNGVKKVLYNRNLSNEWYDFIKKYNKQKLTLDEFYKIYNSFMLTYKSEIQKYIISVYSKSINEIGRIYPIKINENKFNNKDKQIITAGSNKLRSSSKSNEIFFIVRDFETGKWVGPFNEDLYESFDKRFDEDGGIVPKMVKSMKILRRNNDERFEFNSMIDTKNINIDEIRRNGRCNISPYFNYVDVYDDKLGIINEKFFKSLK